MAVIPSKALGLAAATGALAAYGLMQSVGGGDIAVSEYFERRSDPAGNFEGAYVEQIQGATTDLAERLGVAQGLYDQLRTMAVPIDSREVYDALGAVLYGPQRTEHWRNDVDEIMQAAEGLGRKGEEGVYEYDRPTLSTELQLYHKGFTKEEIDDLFRRD